MSFFINKGNLTLKGYASHVRRRPIILQKITRHHENVARIKVKLIFEEARRFFRMNLMFFYDKILM